MFRKKKQYNKKLVQIEKYINTSPGVYVPFVPPPPPPPPPFISVWVTWRPNQTIELPYFISGYYNGIIDWGDGTQTDNTFSNRTHTYEQEGAYEVNVFGDVYGFSFNNSGTKDLIYEVLNWGSIRGGITSADTSWEGMFYGCVNLRLDNLRDSLTIPNNVKSLKSMFRDCNSLFNIKKVENWNLSNVENLDSMFRDCFDFNESKIESWNFNGKLKIMDSLFENCISFNKSLNKWNLNGVKSLNRVFRNNFLFNQFLGGWNTSSVTGMTSMFEGASSFNNGNQTELNWNVSIVKNMDFMFYRAQNFASRIKYWNTQSLTNMESMFSETLYFNDDISNWETGNVRNFQNCFMNAQGFTNSLTGWSLSSAINYAPTLTNSNMTNDNYSQTLIAWANKPVNGLILQAANLKFFSYAQTAHNRLVNLYSWTINDDGLGF